jgi:hypothetical protein
MRAIISALLAPSNTSEDLNALFTFWAPLNFINTVAYRRVVKQIFEGQKL